MSSQREKERIPFKKNERPNAQELTAFQIALIGIFVVFIVAMIVIGLMWAKGHFPF
ncbi:hypothetical protein PP715_06030 [Ralstonia solanacearum]|uniref:hypothetical protein n=1 Tax=Ralstonia solanacearum TaxID=305 RepID=UPI000AB12877|nr:hypothetical protein [Ralstonia solanacearum]MBB6585336.1 hypothetical protein [Ralstonia solanacearum]MCG3577201.1 hypothetical protein [Ralstonia solanacearum]MCL9842299.1 hypothetical protein [Ralstonia solanacearum]MDB0531368.1 hypothetical protein [Ralstonia solanacearum]MDB0536128.1 hypothetical protein [Ralstonia solanacearum]